MFFSRVFAFLISARGDQNTLHKGRTPPIPIITPHWFELPAYIPRMFIQRQGPILSTILFLVCFPLYTRLLSPSKTRLPLGLHYHVLETKPLEAVHL